MPLVISAAEEVDFEDLSLGFVCVPDEGGAVPPELLSELKIGRKPCEASPSGTAGGGRRPLDPGK